jgi:glycosyltransferase involved in cell wall biosynthesis
MKITLVMIVKNEAHVIERCLASVRNHISSYCILDTGSSDRTRELIPQALHGIPGEVHRGFWFNDFSKARNDVFSLAPKDGYLLMIDADETLEVDSGTIRGHVGWDEHQAWRVPCHHAGRVFPRYLLARASEPWRWTGRIHEQLGIYQETVDAGTVDWIRIISHGDGARSMDSEKTARDLEMLKRQVEDEPQNLMHRYHYAESLRLAGDLEKSLLQFLTLAEIGNDCEHRWHSAYMVGRVMMELGFPLEPVTAAMLKAHAMDRSRVEPLAWLARYSLDHHQPQKAYAYLEIASGSPKPPPDALMVEPDWHHGGIQNLIERAVRQQ